ncbi:porin family protein [Rhodonellum sp.]|uniref:porin family protein n=1 Tax=Rhodonellum sp. TaxID=2231180 RepID=UPI002722C648|nr:porin family protein [Rhodonellum sp.]MDO9554648.1 porin family protein [Rhodonellum sp.]
MKFYLIVLTSLVLMTGTVSAQHANIGIKGGLNLYNLDLGAGNSFDTKAGIHLGLLGHIHLANQFALQPEIMYSGQGAKFMNGGVETKINLDYINVPVLLQYMFDNGFRLQAGPQVGFLLGAKYKTNNNSVDFKDDYKSIDFGLGFGGSYVHTPSGFGVDARYNLGLSNINENTNTTSKNRGFQLGVFYLLGHK